MEKRSYLGAPSTKGETQKQLNKRLAKDPMGPSRAPKRLRVPYVEDLYLTNREDGNLVDDELLAWLLNLKSSETFKGENTSKTLPEREGDAPASPLTTTGNKTLERTNKI
jgi:hypothetical protein